VRTTFTKLLREIFPLDMSVSTKPAKVGLYRSGFRDDLLDTINNS
jgi:hypothetical protein